MFRLKEAVCLIRSLIFLVGFTGQWALADDYFNPSLIENIGSQVSRPDLSIFEKNGSQVPGTYHVDININSERVANQQAVIFTAVTGPDGRQSLQPCLSSAQLQSWGVKTVPFAQLEQGGCANLSAIPDAKATLLFGQQLLQLSIPQAALSAQARGYVPREQWDPGIIAGLLNYSFNGSEQWNSQNQSRHSGSQFLNLRPGLNMGDWRLRNYSTWSRNNQGETTSKAIYTYVQRDISRLNSQLLLGDSVAPSDVFESVPLRGVQLSSDDEMLPDSVRGYAPVVRGIARTNARVVIRQGGFIIYQNTVAPGAFEITDIYPTGGSGDLLVTVQEADGSEQQLVFPFASLPVLQREGQLKYSLSGGQYRSYDSNAKKLSFSQLTGIYGLHYGLTLYGGTQIAQDYQAGALGVGSNLGALGALSTDVSHSSAKMRGEERRHGQSWRTRYSKNFVETGTNFAIAGYRYSTSEYATLQDVAESYRPQQNLTRRENRYRAEILLNQNLFEERGSLFLSAIREEYWGSGRKMQSISAGYGNSWHGIGYNLNYTYAQNKNQHAGNQQRENDQSFSLSLSVPLSQWLPSTWGSYGMNGGNNQGTSHTVGVSGTALAGNNLNWGVQQGYTHAAHDNPSSNSTNLNASYQGSLAELNAGYSRAPNQQQVNYGVKGSVLVHEGGVTLGQSLGETVMLVKAPGAKGVEVVNHTGVKTDWQGYAVLPYASPYRKNEVALDMDSLPEDTEVSLSSKTLVPTRGAVARAEFDIQIGYRALAILRQRDGTLVPFGAMVSNPAQGKAQGSIVGDNGQVYLTGLAEQGQLLVSWGQGANNRCKVSYHLPEHQLAAGIYKLDHLQCQ
ncbi:fimbrial assembly protein [Serratia sp. Ag1]|nr:fimbrial assembly protein [Serratia sp. Ag2]KFL00631.1 fimbrial assembly protein [Serratia sp. Ag1]